jgi:hypothetical protein
VENYHQALDSYQWRQWFKKQMKMRERVFFLLMGEAQCREMTGFSKRVVRQLAGQFSQLHTVHMMESKLPLLDQLTVFCAWLTHGGNEQVKNLQMDHLVSLLTTTEMDDICFGGWMETAFCKFDDEFRVFPRNVGTKKPSCLRRLYPKASCFITYLPLGTRKPEDGKIYIIAVFALDGRIIYVSSAIVVHNSIDPPNLLANFWDLAAFQPGMQVNKN